jgi:hypothetical protein
MNDDDLKHKLAARDLTSPGIPLDEAVRRAGGRAPSRRPAWVLRLAMAALVVWVAVFAVQAAVEHNLNGLVPPSRSPVVREPASSLLVAQELLLAELLGEQVRAPAVAEQEESTVPPARRDSVDHSRSGSAPIGRWTHV